MALDVLAEYGQLLNTGPAILLTAFSVVAATVYTILRLKNKTTDGMDMDENEITQTHQSIKRAATGRLEERLNANRNVAESMMPGRWSTHGSGDIGTDNNPAEASNERDPLEFCEHIPGEVKRVKARLAQQKIEQDMSAADRAAERAAEAEQMSAIFKLLQEQEEKYGINSMDDMQEQMKLYSTAHGHHDN